MAIMYSYMPHYTQIMSCWIFCSLHELPAHLVRFHSYSCHSHFFALHSYSSYVTLLTQCRLEQLWKYTFSYGHHIIDHFAHLIIIIVLKYFNPTRYNIYYFTRMLIMTFTHEDVVATRAASKWRILSEWIKVFVHE